METVVFLRIGIVILALGGFSLSYYIGHKKSAKAPLVCPIGSTCDEVVHSDYSKFLFVPLEIWGQLYYGLVAISYLVLALGLTPPILAGIVTLLGITVFAFFFSMYLTFVQAFFLRQWCTWCLISASLCTMIFILSLLSYDLSFL